MRVSRQWQKKRITGLPDGHALAHRTARSHTDLEETKPQKLESKNKNDTQTGAPKVNDLKNRHVPVKSRRKTHPWEPSEMSVGQNIPGRDLLTRGLAFFS
jgi:hypothetical protein